jgi:hypothetical protein
VFAVEGSFSDANTLGRWITHYYANPEPHRVAEAIHAASSQGFMKNAQKASPLIGFVAGVISKNPSMAQPLAEQLISLPEVDQPALILGIWYSSHPEAKPLLKELTQFMPKHKVMIDYLLNNDRPTLLELPLEQGAWVLDVLWGYFMATGDEALIVRIMSALPWINIKGDVPRLLIGGAAKWSLISNAIQHKAVMTICLNARMSQPKAVTDVLREVIAEAEKDMKAGKVQ